MGQDRFYGVIKLRLKNGMPKMVYQISDVLCHSQFWGCHTTLPGCMTSKKMTSKETKSMMNEVQSSLHNTLL